MKLKKQLMLGGTLLAVTATACLKLMQWAEKKIKEREDKGQ